MKRILLIDDNDCYNKISKLILTRIFENKDVEIKGFTDSREGLAYIVLEYEHTPIETILLLDINMPFLNGWSVLDALNRLPDSIKQYFTVYLLSSSIDPRDKDKAARSPMVKDYLEKPLSKHLSIIKECMLHKSANV